MKALSNKKMDGYQERKEQIMTNSIKECEFEQKVLKNEGMVLIDFYATWCGPCQMLSPIIEELAGELEDVFVCSMDTDEAMDTARANKVAYLPTVVLFKNGTEVDRKVGFTTKEELLEMIESHR